MERVHQRRSPPGNPIMVSMTRIPGGMLMLMSFPHHSATSSASVGPASAAAQPAFRSEAISRGTMLQFSMRRTEMPENTAEPLVLVDADGPVLTVTLNRPEKRNATNAEVLCRLYDA